MIAYLYDNLPGDPRLPHKLKDSENIDADYLASFGVEYSYIPVDENLEAQLVKYARERAYKNKDEVFVSPDRMPDYQKKIDIFFTEHLHVDDEVRFVKGGSGFFDVRDTKDRWIRIHVQQGDLIILPSGIYHRFVTDEKDFINAVRLFKDDPVWTPVNRSPESDLDPSRLGYLRTIKA